MEEQDGKPVAIKANFGPGMESLSTVTAWDPPHKFAADSQNLGPNAPNVATEWIMGGQVLICMRLYLYGDRAAATVVRDEPLWQAWVAERFPASGGASSGCA